MLVCFALRRRKAAVSPIRTLPKLASCALQSFYHRSAAWFEDAAQREERQLMLAAAKSKTAMATSRNRKPIRGTFKQSQI